MTQQLKYCESHGLCDGN